MDKQELYVVLSADSFRKLMELPEELKLIQGENKQLRNEVDGLRRMFSEVMQAFGDLKRSVR